MSNGPSSRASVPGCSLLLPPRNLLSITLSLILLQKLRLLSVVPVDAMKGPHEKVNLVVKVSSKLGSGLHQESTKLGVQLQNLIELKIIIIKIFLRIIYDTEKRC